MSILESNTVLVLNSSWRVVDVRSAAQAFTDLAGGAYSALDIQADYMVPVMLKDWIKLPIREGDDAVRTPRQLIRIPRVIIALNFRKVPVKKKRCNLRNLAEHYDGTCAVTGQKLTRSTMSSEHVVPVSKGGKNGWGNEVLCHRDVNSRRGNLPYEEVGLKAPRIKPPPREVPMEVTIVNTKGYREWDLILGSKK